MKVYVASSWRNPTQPEVVRSLRALSSMADLGLDVYDFRNPPEATGFGWNEVDATYPSGAAIAGHGPVLVPFDRYKAMLAHPRAQEGFRSDMAALTSADATVLVLPCGKSAHLELGYAIGAGQRTAILAPDGEAIEPELMYLMADLVTDNAGELVEWLTYYAKLVARVGP